MHISLWECDLYARSHPVLLKLAVSSTCECDGARSDPLDILSASLPTGSGAMDISFDMVFCQCPVGLHQLDRSKIFKEGKTGHGTADDEMCECSNCQEIKTY